MDIKRRIHFAHALVSIFGNSSMQVSERVSLNKFHFMHEYRDISVWIIVLAFDRKILSKRGRKKGMEPQREVGGEVRGCERVRKCGRKWNVLFGRTGGDSVGWRVCVHPNLCDFNAALHCSPTLQALPKSDVLEGSRKGGRMKEKWWSEQKTGKKWVQKNGRRRRKIQEMATRKENKEMERERAANEVKAWRCGQSEKCKK